MIRALVLCLGLFSAPFAALAEPVSASQANKMLYDLRKRNVQVIPLPGLDPGDMAILQEALRISASGVKYYGSIALAPDEGMSPETVAQSSNFHTPAAADAAALADCNARRDGGTPCVVVARTLPNKYSPQALELSVDGTEAFRKEYRRARKPKAMAISPATGKWSIQRGDRAADAAILDCNRQAAAFGVSDCVLAVVD